jgi:hypothetical protein
MELHGLAAKDAVHSGVWHHGGVILGFFRTGIADGRARGDALFDSDRPVAAWLQLAESDGSMRSPHR